MPEGPPGWPPPDAEVHDALQQVFHRGDWGRYHGAECPRLIDELAAFHQTEHVTLCCSGTLAVELALRGLGVSPGDEVILAGYDFPGNFRSIEALGAKPVLVDLDPANWNLSAEALPAAVSPTTRAVVVSHLHGGAAPMRQIMETAEAHGLLVVEDACQCPGAVIQGRLAGTWGHAGVLSFGGSKLLSAGRGGAVLTADAAVHQRMKVFANRGNQAFPLSELQAAVLRPQLKRLNERNAARAAAAAFLARRLAPLECVRPLQNSVEDSQPGYYKFGLQYDPTAAGGHSREEYLEAAQAEGLALYAGFPGFAGRGARRCRKVGQLPESLAAAARMIVLHHPVLLEPQETIERVAMAFEKLDAAFAATGQR